jgi:hypothetical protein
MIRQSPNLRYDLFKLIVAVLILVVVIWMLLRAPQPATSKAALPSTAPTAEILPSNTPILATDTAAPELPAPTTTRAVEPTSPAAEQDASTTPLQADEPATPEAGCPLAMPTRLKVGDQVRVVSPLHMRSAPEISSNLVQTNQAGTQLEIIEGPVCMPFQNGAHLWWKVLRQDGASGWSAEGTANGSAYFMEPLQP